MSNVDQTISDFATGILLRYYRSGSHVTAETPRIEIERDREILRSHWAISAPVQDLVKYLCTHQHETHALLGTRRRMEDAIARGRIDMRATILHRMQTGLHSALVTDEPIRSFDTGPNQVLAWIIHHAKIWGTQLQGNDRDGLTYASLAEELIIEIDRVRRFDALRDALRSPTITRRPSPGTLQNARKSRRPVYQLAAAAYSLLKGVEEGQEDALLAVISSTLIGPLEVWRRLELAVAATIGQALETETGARLHLNPIAEEAAPIAVCGRYSIFWQNITKCYTQPALEPSEIRGKAILYAYGITTGSDRPDLILMDTKTNSIVSVIEVKYLAADTATSRFREAADQIIRYSRGYSSGPKLEELIGRSLIVMSVNAPTIRYPGPGVPSALDLNGVTGGLISPWLKAVLH